MAVIVNTVVECRSESEIANGVVFLSLRMKMLVIKVNKSGRNHARKRRTLTGALVEYSIV